MNCRCKTMIRLTTGAEQRIADTRAVEESGITSLSLMERAARALAAAAIETASDKSAVVFCGNGNNGGDGLAAALILLKAGFKVLVLLMSAPDKMTGDCAEMYGRYISAGGEALPFEVRDIRQKKAVMECGVIIDAMLGTGLKRPLSGLFSEAAELINASASPTIACDIASGVDSDTGAVAGVAVKADKTVTFAAYKIGQFVEPGCVYSGEVTVADIGTHISETSPEPVYIITSAAIKGIIPKRAKISHKGDYGKVLIAGGSIGYSGAPVLSAEAAVRSGSGLVSLGVPRDIYIPTAVKCVEAMPFPLPADGAGRMTADAAPDLLRRLGACDAVLIGPGLGRSDEINELVCKIIREARTTILLDADGINAISGNINILDASARPVIITPHEGEFMRLGYSAGNDRIGVSRSFACKHGCILVLKGHRTICAFPDGSAYVNTTGNPGMARGGSGDVLSGIILSLIARLPTKEAVLAAVWLHGRSGDIAADRFGEECMTPSDIIACLPEAFREIT